MVMKLKTIRQRCSEEPEAQEQVESCKGKQETDLKALGQKLEEGNRIQSTLLSEKLIGFALQTLALATH